jgi:hypothetical protein
VKIDPDNPLQVLHLTEAVADLERQFGRAIDPDVLRAVIDKVRDETAINAAARRLLREDVEDPAPVWWKPIGDGTHQATYEINRATEWKVRVQIAAGDFLDWCEEAGITFHRGRFQFAEQLRYSLDDDKAAELGLTPEQEDKAAWGHFCLWWCTKEELVEMAAA